MQQFCSRSPLDPPLCQATNAVLGVPCQCCGHAAVLLPGQGEGLGPRFPLFLTLLLWPEEGVSLELLMNIHCCLQLMLPTTLWCFWSVGGLLH